MSVIIRLQGLSWTANATDIRRFFQGLAIPDGGVHIVGGDKGDAFIAFSTDEDARRAMLMNNARLNDSPVQLLLSSKTEMQNVISVARGNMVVSVPNIAQRVAVDSFSRPSGLPSGSVSGFTSANSHQTSYPIGSKEVSVGASLGGGDFIQSVREPFNSAGMGQRGLAGQFQKALERDDALHNRGFMSDQRPALETGSRGFELSRSREERGSFGSFSDRRPIDDFRGRESSARGFIGREGSNRRDDIGGRFGAHMEGVSGRDGESSFGLRDGSRSDLHRRNGVHIRNEFESRQGFRNDEVVNDSFSSRRFEGSSIKDRIGFRESHMEQEISGFNQRDVITEDFGRIEPMRDGDRGSVRQDDSFRGDGRDFRFSGSAPIHDRVGNREFDHSSFDRSRDSWRSSQRGETDEVGRYSNLDRFPRDQLRERDSFRDYGKRKDFERRRPEDKASHAEPSVFVKASGMPWTVSYKDVRRFFGGLEIPRDGLKLINDKKGRRVGVGYVKFSTLSFARSALKRNGQYMGERYVDVQYSTEKDFEEAVDSYVPRTSDDDHLPHFSKRDRSRSPLNKSSGESSDRIVLLKNLSSRTEKKDIVDFFSPLGVDNKNIHMDFDSDGKLKGSVFVEFSSTKDQKEALSFHKKTLKGNSVEVYATTKAKMDASLKHHKDSHSGDKKKESKDNIQHSMKHDVSSKEKESSHRKGTSSTKSSFKYFCVRLRGLPFQVTVRDIKNFFHGLEIPGRGIHIVMKQDGTAHGVGFVQFVTSSDCEKAVERDMQYIGKRYINVEPLSKGEMISEIKELHAKLNINNQRPAPLPMSKDIDSRIFDTDSRIPLDDFVDRALDYQRGGARDFNEGAEFQTMHSDFDIRSRGDHDSRRIPEERGYADYDSAQERYGDRGQFAADDDRRHAGSRRRESFGRFSSAVLGAQNVHFRTTIDDILDFFRGYHSVPDSVRIRYNDDGRPTGDALIGFETVEDAQHALRELNNQMLHGRNVRLYFASS